MFLSCRESQSVREFDGSSKKIEEFVDSKANQLPRTELKDPPWTGHFCDKCESKDFGCYPKSTSKGLRTQAGLTCNHAWKQITEEEYNNFPKVVVDFSLLKQYEKEDETKAAHEPACTAGGCTIV